MHEALHRYFWDHTEAASDRFRLTRLLEYASFEDLMKVPFDLVRGSLAEVEPARLRTTEKRRRFVLLIAPFVDQASSWREAILLALGIPTGPRSR